MPELTITGKTTLADVQRFADSMSAGHQIRAKTNKAGQTVLYSKDPSAFSFGFKSGQRAGKAQLAKDAIQTLVDKQMGKTDKGVLLQNLVKGHVTKPTQTFLQGSDLQRILGKAATIEAMVDSTKTVSIGSRPQIMVAMGQGAIGRMDQFQFYSDSFSSCMPVILYNRNTGIGGLFHVPSPSVDRDDLSLSYREGVRDALAEMISLVKPTDIIVKPGGDGLSEGSSLFKVDFGPKASEVAKYVAQDMDSIAKSQKLGTELHFLPEQSSGTVVVTGGRDGGLVIEKNDIRCGSEVNLLRKDLPSHLSDQVLTWSFVHKGDESVLVGSKF